MSADAISVCSACYSRALDVPFEQATINQFNNVAINATVPISTELREYHDIYIDQGHMVLEISGTCRDCGYHFEFVHRQPLPQPQEAP